MDEKAQCHLASIKGVSVIFDMQDTARSLERAFSEALVPAPLGIYTPRKLEPVIVPGVGYYVVGKNGRTSFTSVEQAKGAVYRDDGTCVLTASQVANASTFTGRESFLPYRGLKIMKVLHDNQIDSRIQWRTRSGGSASKIASHFKPEFAGEDFLDLLADFSDIAYENIRALIIDHEWHIYYTQERFGTCLKVERGPDYRINYFMERLATGEIKL